MTVAVLGASGVVGTALVSALAESEEVVAVSRRPDASPVEGVRPVAADVTDAASVRRSLEGVAVAYYLVHSLGTPDYAVVDRRAAETVASSCTSAASATTGPTCRHTCEAGSRRPWRSRPAPFPSRPCARPS